MQRITISLTDEIASALDQLVECRGYANRSEAVRDLVREAASRDATAGNTLSLGVLSYVFDHEQRDLARRLTTRHHDHHVLNLSTLHLHLDRKSCLEVVLRGHAQDIRQLADQISTEWGVRLGDLRLIRDLSGRA